MSDLSEQIAADASKPQSTTADGVSSTKRSLTELIAADRYLRDIDAAASPAANFKNMVSVLVPPGGH